MNTENSKMNEPHKFVLNLSQKVRFKKFKRTCCSSKVISKVYYTWKNIRQQYKNNKPKIITPMWNDEFELLDGSYSVSDIQDVECNIRNM